METSTSSTTHNRKFHKICKSKPQRCSTIEQKNHTIPCNIVREIKSQRSKALNELNHSTSNSRSKPIKIVNKYYNPYGLARSSPNPHFRHNLKGKGGVERVLSQAIPSSSSLSPSTDDDLLFSSSGHRTTPPSLAHLSLLFKHRSRGGQCEKKKRKLSTVLGGNPLWRGKFAFFPLLSIESPTSPSLLMPSNPHNTGSQR